MIKIIGILAVAMFLSVVSSNAWANVKGVRTMEETLSPKLTATPTPTPRPTISSTKPMVGCYISITSKITKTTVAPTTTPNKGIMTSDAFIKALKSGKTVTFSEAGNFVSSNTTSKLTATPTPTPRPTVSPTPARNIMTSDEIIKTFKTNNTITFSTD
ncbi:MAG: hypothetical protein NT014_03565 [Candidatus Omnitrophica bacterium]|nr:hypothetical protein [Candidatus Omnitrophota bacterium]